MKDSSKTHGYVISENRLQKAKKIEAVLKDYFQNDIVGYSMLDIGTGTGDIAAYFSDANKVTGIDIANRLSAVASDSSMNFVIAKDELIPFTESSFDIIISNHVIEHIGNPEKHLQEIHRCLKSGGVCYISTPNRVFPFEVHTKTFLLHYLPYRAFFRCLLLQGNKRFTEPIYLLSYWRQKYLFRKNGFTINEYTKEVLDYPEKYHTDETLSFRIPRFAQALSKTNIFLLFYEQ